MCITDIPKPKAAPPPPNTNMANLDAASAMRRASTEGRGMSDNILTRLKDSEVAASGKKKRLGQ